MKKILISTIFALFAFSFIHAQTPQSEGYLLIQMININGSKTVINIISPTGESKQIECYKMPAMSFSMDNIRDILSKNQGKLLEVLESYRKQGYELKSVSNEYQGVVTNYLMVKK